MSLTLCHSQASAPPFPCTTYVLRRENWRERMHMLKEKEGWTSFRWRTRGVLVIFGTTCMYYHTYPGGKNSGTVVLHNNNIIGTSK